MQIDWNGAAVFLGAFGAFCGSMLTVFMQYMNWRDQRRMRDSDARRERTLNKVAVAVNVEPEAHDGKTS